MNIGLLNIMHNKVWDFRPDMAQGYADALRNAIELHVPNDIEKEQGFFLSKKGFVKDGVTHAANFEEKLYVDNIRHIEDHLYWNDEELQEDDQIINVVVVDGPVTRDGDICSYGTKDFRDQVMYANTIPQVVGHLFIINTPGGQASCRNDYETMINDCREKGKPTVMFVDGMCCSSGVNLACRGDRVIVMSGKDEFGCIGTMAAFWAVAHDTVDSDGYRYVELVGSDCPEKNDWYREAAKGEYEKLQAELDKETKAFHNEVRENRPLVTDDMLTGRVFEAQEVIPALVDEIGDLNRAIECVFELANETMTAARFMQAEPKDDPAGEGDGQEPDHEPEDEPGEKKQESTHQIIDNMTEEEKKAQEAAAAQAAQEAEEQAQQEQQSEEGAQEEQQSEEGAQQEQASEEEQQAQEEAPAGEQSQEEQNQEEQAAEEQQQEQQEEEGAQEEQQAEEQAPASQENIENAQADIDKIQETLHNAEQMIADKDQEIAELKSDMEGKQNSIEQLQADIDQARKDIEAANGTIAEAKKSIEEKDALIGQLKKQVSDLKAEVKELAGKPAPMTDEQSGIPAGNGTGEAPKGRQKRITRDMSYEEIRAAKKAERETAEKK